MTAPPATMLRDPDAPPPPSNASFTWTDARLLGFKAMDEHHMEFYRVAQSLLICDTSTMLAAIDAFEQHAIEHFEAEDEWMRSTNFPARDCHMDEHAAVLASTREVKALLESGQRGEDLAHDFALHLFQWFPGHADYLDSALAGWMSKRLHGGQPVVLKKRLVLP